MLVTPRSLEKSLSALGELRELHTITSRGSVGSVGFNLSEDQVGNVRVKRYPVSQLNLVGYIAFSRCGSYSVNDLK